MVADPDRRRRCATSASRSSSRAPWCRVSRAPASVEGEDFRYVEQKEGTHNLPYEDVAAQWLDEANKWLARWNPAFLPGEPQPATAGRAGRRVELQRPFANCTGATDDRGIFGVAAAILRWLSAPARRAAARLPPCRSGSRPRRSATLADFSAIRASRADGKRILAVTYAGGEKVIVVYELDGATAASPASTSATSSTCSRRDGPGAARVLLKVFGMNNEMGIEIPLSRLFLSISTRRS